METNIARHLRHGAETVRQLNSAAPEGRTYLLTVEEEGVAVHARQRRHQAKLLVPWAVLETSVLSPIPGLLKDARGLLLLRLAREDD